MKYTYFDYMAGRCNDLEYYRSAYGGAVIKCFADKDSLKQHPFYVIKRRITDVNGDYLELKIYDADRGCLCKEKVYKLKTSNKEYWEEYTLSYDFKSYVDFLVDTFKIFPPEKQRKTKQTKKIS